MKLVIEYTKEANIKLNNQKNIIWEGLLVYALVLVYKFTKLRSHSYFSLKLSL